MGKSTQYAEPKLLRDKREKLLNTRLKVAKKPPSPIDAISNTTCEVVDLSRSVRNLYIIPLFFGLCVLCWLHVNDFLSLWRSAESHALWRIHSDEKDYGKEFYKNTNDPQKLMWYSDVGPDLKMSFQEYLHCRYNNYTASKKMKHKDIVFLIFGCTVVPCYGLWAFGYKRRAPLFFDRERQLVYTWRFGKVAAQRYDGLQLYETAKALTFVLPIIGTKRKQKGKLVSLNFVVSPSGNPHFNFVSSYQPLLAFIAQFMESGLENVFPRNHWKPWKSSWPTLYLRVDKKPEDFERQLQYLLQKIDEKISQLQ